MPWTLRPNSPVLSRSCSKRVLFFFRRELPHMRAFLFCHNLWPSCYVIIPQFCHNAWWCWRNTPDVLHIGVLGKRLCRCNFAVCEDMVRKIEVQETVKKAFNFLQAIFAPPPKWRPWHGPCLPYPRYATVSRCCQNAVIFLTHSDNLRKKTQRSKWDSYLAATLAGAVW